MLEWLGVAWQLVLGLIGLSILVFVHELGHFLVAKYYKVRVKVFSIGFGKRLLWWKRGETTYCISAIPFGGYVAMAGEDPREQDTGEADPGSFSAQPIRVRAAIAFAGPAINILFAIATLFLLYMVGVNEPVNERLTIGLVLADSPAGKVGIQAGDTIVAVNGHPAKGWEKYREEVATSIGVPVKLTLHRAQGVVLEKTIVPIEDDELGIGRDGIYPPIRVVVDEKPAPDSPAETSGLLKGDLLLSIGGVRIDSVQQVIRAINGSAGKPVQVVYQRVNDTLKTQVTPLWNAQTQRYMVGIQLSVAALVESKIVRRGPVEAIQKSMQTSWHLATSVFRYLSRMAEKRVSSKSLSSVPGIVAIIGHSWLESFHQLMMILALISVNLGVMNLLPLAITDGGILMFLGLEAIRGKPLSRTLQARIQQVAMAFFIALFVYLSFQDILRFPMFIH